MNIVLMRKSDQNQLNLSRDDATKLLAMAGAPSDIHLGNPKNGKPSLRLTLKIKGRKFVWVQGDTHSLWKSHQIESDGAVFDSLWGQLKKGDAVTVEILDAELVAGMGTKPKRIDELKLDLD